MTLDDLIEILEEARDGHGGDIEVRVAYQRRYPKAATVDGVAEGEEDGRPVVFVCTGHDTGYASGDLWNRLATA